MSVDENEATPVERKRYARTKRVTKAFVVLALLWGLAAYILIPFIWLEYADHDPHFDDAPHMTQTSDKHPGDPLNVGLVGSQIELEAIMLAAKWYPATALGLKSDLKIIEDTILSRPDVEAPVSSLYLYGRREDCAFEQPVGNNPRHRHHVRFWKTDKLSDDGRVQWIGSAVYDQRVGISRTTGQITHVTALNVDTERDYLFDCLKKTNDLAQTSIVKGFHTTLKGLNGGGDPWETDGDLYTGVIAIAK